MLSAFYEAATGRAPDMLRAYLLAVLIQMVAVNGLAELGVLDPVIPPFFGVATALGGLVFGVGMFLSMGCAGAVLYRIGEGKLDYGAAITAYAISVWVSMNWLAQPIRDLVGGPGAVLTLHRAVTVDRWLVVAIFIVAGLLWVIRGKRHPYFGGWDWSRTGLMIGLLGVVTWADSALAGESAGLGTMQGSDSLSQLVFRADPAALNWHLFLVAGIPLGSFIATRIAGQMPTKPLRSERILHALVGGASMGVGASIAAGDNVLHGLSGVPLLAVSSIVFMAFAFIGVWLSVRVEKWAHVRVVQWIDAIAPSES